MVQVYSNKMASDIEVNATVGYPVYLVLVNFSKMSCKRFIDHDHILAACLPVASFRRSTDVEDTGTALKQTDITLPAVVLPSEELPSTSS